MLSDLSLKVLGHIAALKGRIKDLQASAKILTKCKRKGVGVCVMTWDGEHPNYLGRYFNGIDSVNCTNVKGNCGCVHAEQVAICAALKAGWTNVWLLQNYSPCTNCANLIVTSGIISGVIYTTVTEHDLRGLQILKDTGIHYEKL